MKSLFTWALAGILALVIVVVVVIDDGEEDTQCMDTGTGGVGSSASVNTDGTAFPTDSNATQFSSGFGQRWGTLHAGVDLAGPIGTPIFAFADGVVADAGPASGFGNWVVLDHKIDGEDHSTVYGHMAVYDVAAGDEVKAGDKIAEIGNEGGSTGPHLHFEYYNGLRLAGGTPIDPQPMLEQMQADGGSGDRSSGDGAADSDDADSGESADSGSQDTGSGEQGQSGGQSGQYTSEGEDVSLGVPNDVNSLEERQLDNVRAIISIGKDRDAPDSVIKAALMAAGPESGYRMLASRAVPESLNHPNDGVTPGDATSVGLFQIQTPMHMPPADAMNREKHINWFYDTAEELADPSQHPGDIAANVENPREDLRGKYREWEATADTLLESEGNISPSSDPCAPGGSGEAGESGDDDSTPANSSEFGKKVIAAARTQRGQPYVWGGGNHDGPTGGGFDCSGLTMYAYAQAGGPKLDHYTTNQMNSDQLTERSPDDIQPGDLVFFNGASDPQHVGIAIDDKTMIHAPTEGDVVKEAPISDGGDLVAVRAPKEQSND